MGMVVDARGLDCPQPVILTNKAFDEVDELTTIVDNEVARENVAKLARTKGFIVEAEEKNGDFHLYLTRESSGAQVDISQAAGGPTVLMISSDSMGSGSDDLGRKLMTSFIQVLHDITPQPDTIVFVNSGVRLVIEGSQVIEDLRTLEEMGTELLACGTCLGYYDLKDAVSVGKISNMFEIASAMFGAGKIISP